MAEKPMSYDEQLDVMGALVFACVRRLSTDDQRAFYADLMALRKGKLDEGDTRVGKTLEALCRACMLAAPGTFRH